MRQLVILIALFSLLACTQKSVDPIKQALQDDMVLTEALLNDASTTSSAGEHIAVITENFRGREKIISDLEAFHTTEANVLGKKLAIDFLRLENSFCEIAVEWQVRKREADRLEFFSRGNFPPVYQPLRQASRHSADITQQLVISEVKLIPLGWNTRWGDRSWRTAANVAGKPEILDESQWQFIQTNKLTNHVETQNLLIWYRMTDNQGAKDVKVASIRKNNLSAKQRHEAGNWLFTSSVTLYCRDSLMTESGNRKMMEGSTFTVQNSDYTSPIAIQHSEKIDILVSNVCKGVH